MAESASRVSNRYEMNADFPRFGFNRWPTCADCTCARHVETAMHTFVIRVDRTGISPIDRHHRLDELMESLGFFPWRPGIASQDQDGDDLLSQWEYAGNHSLDADSLQRLIQRRIRAEIYVDVDVEILRVRIKGEKQEIAGGSRIM
jgi:hypothetical protein